MVEEEEVEEKTIRDCGRLCDVEKKVEGGGEKVREGQKWSGEKFEGWNRWGGK